VVCDTAWALKRGFLTAKAARPDVYRAANNILRMALEGRLCLCFSPPGYTTQQGQWMRFLHWILFSVSYNVMLCNMSKALLPVCYSTLIAFWPLTFNNFCHTHSQFVQHVYLTKYTFLLLARYIPNVAKRSIWDQCNVRTNQWPTSVPGRTSNGHISTTLLTPLFILTSFISVLF